MCYSPMIGLTLGLDGVAVSTHKFKVAVYYTSGLYGAGSARGIYQITQLLPPEGDDLQYKKSKVPPRRTSGWPRKVSLITLYRRTIPSKGKPGARRTTSYRRFRTAAEAIRFAVEEFPAIRTLNAWMRVGDERFGGDDIRRLYETHSYPRRRRVRKVQLTADSSISAGDSAT
jgi:hypothetical protein